MTGINNFNNNDRKNNKGVFNVFKYIVLIFAFMFAGIVSGQESVRAECEILGISFNYCVDGEFYEEKEQYEVIINTAWETHTITFKSFEVQGYGVQTGKVQVYVSSVECGFKHKEINSEYMVVACKPTYHYYGTIPSGESYNGTTKEIEMSYTMTIIIGGRGHKIYSYELEDDLLKESVSDPSVCPTSINAYQAGDGDTIYVSVPGEVQGFLYYKKEGEDNYTYHSKWYEWEVSVDIDSASVYEFLVEFNAYCYREYSVTVIPKPESLPRPGGTEAISIGDDYYPKITQIDGNEAFTGVEEKNGNVKITQDYMRIDVKKTVNNKTKAGVIKACIEGSRPIFTYDGTWGKTKSGEQCYEVASNNGKRADWNRNIYAAIDIILCRSNYQHDNSAFTCSPGAIYKNLSKDGENYDGWTYVGNLLDDINYFNTNFEKFRLALKVYAINVEKDGTKKSDAWSASVWDDYGYYFTPLPKVTLTNDGTINNGYYPSSVTYTISASNTNAGTVKLYTPSICMTESYNVKARPSGDGKNSIEVSSSGRVYILPSNGAGTGLCQIYDVQIDNTDPTLSFTEDISTEIKQQHTIKVAYSDSQSGVNTAKYCYYDADNQSDCTPNEDIVNNSITLIDLNGKYHVKIKVVDNCGNDAVLTTSTPLQFDNTPPTVSSISIDDTGWKPSHTISFTHRDATAVEYCIIMTRNQSDCTYTPIAINATSITTTTMFGDGVSVDGEYHFLLRLTDGANNYGFSDWVTVKVDNIAPTVSVSHTGYKLSGDTNFRKKGGTESNIYGIDHEVTAQFSSDVSSVSCAWGDMTTTNLISVDKNTTTFNKSKCLNAGATLADGEYKFLILVVDKAGNNSNSGSPLLSNFTLIFDTKVPEVTSEKSYTTIQEDGYDTTAIGNNGFKFIKKYKIKENNKTFSVDDTSLGTGSGAYDDDIISILGLSNYEGCIYKIFNNREDYTFEFWGCSASIEEEIDIVLKKEFLTDQAGNRISDDFSLVSGLKIDNKVDTVEVEIPPNKGYLFNEDKTFDVYVTFSGAQLFVDKSNGAASSGSVPTLCLSDSIEEESGKKNICSNNAIADNGELGSGIGRLTYTFKVQKETGTFNKFYFDYLESTDLKDYGRNIANFNDRYHPIEFEKAIILNLNESTISVDKIEVSTDNFATIFKTYSKENGVLPTILYSNSLYMRVTIGHSYGMFDKTRGDSIIISQFKLGEKERTKIDYKENQIIVYFEGSGNLTDGEAQIHIKSKFVSFNGAPNKDTEFTVDVKNDYKVFDDTYYGCVGADCYNGSDGVNAKIKVNNETYYNAAGANVKLSDYLSSKGYTVNYSKDGNLEFKGLLEGSNIVSLDEGLYNEYGV